MTWSSVDWTATEAVVGRIQDRIFRAAKIKRPRLEPDDEQSSCPVLRGLGSGNGARLPAGTVVATGPGVTRVAVGDLVCPIFAQTWIEGPLREDHWMGMLGGPRDGVLQEYMGLPEDGLVKMPAHLDAVHAAALPCA